MKNYSHMQTVLSNPKWSQHNKFQCSTLDIPWHGHILAITRSMDLWHTNSHSPTKLTSWGKSKNVLWMVMWDNKCGSFLCNFHTCEIATFLANTSMSIDKDSHTMSLDCKTTTSPIPNVLKQLQQLNPLWRGLPMNNCGIQWWFYLLVGWVLAPHLWAHLVPCLLHTTITQLPQMNFLYPMERSWLCLWIMLTPLQLHGLYPYFDSLQKNSPTISIFWGQ